MKVSSLPARVVSVRSCPAALRGNSFSFLPLRVSAPVAAASSSARSSERLQDATPGALDIPWWAAPVAAAPAWWPTVKEGTALSAESNTEAAITQLTLPLDRHGPARARTVAVRMRSARRAERRTDRRSTGEDTNVSACVDWNDTLLKSFCLTSNK